MNAIRNWWVYEFIGAMLVVLSLLVFVRPVSGFAALVLAFGFCFLLAGIMRTIFAFTNKTTLDNWGWYFAGGLLDILIGTFFLGRPDIAALALPLYVGFFLLIGGVAAIAKAIDLKRFNPGGENKLIVIGIMTLIFAILIVFNPGLGLLTIVTLTAFALMTHGFFYLALGMKLKKVSIKWRSASMQGPLLP